MPGATQDPRYHSLDLWRGVACVAVVFHHAGFVLLWSEVGGDTLEGRFRWLIKSGLHFLNLGVPLFFVISGYCIAASADATRRRQHSCWLFLARRFWRIYPPYWGAILFFLAVTFGCRGLGKPGWLRSHYALELIPPESLNFWQWIGNVTLTETWRPHIGGGPWNILTRVAWSLCYEEQFYLLCFLGLLLFRRWLYRYLAVITILAGLIRVVAHDIGAFRFIEGTFPQLWHEFAVGLAVYYRINRANHSHVRHGIDLALVALAVLGWYFAPETTPVAHSTVVAAVFGLILVYLHPLDTRLHESAWLRPLRECGRRCYSVYLIHLPFCTVGSLSLLDLGWTHFWVRALGTVPVVATAALGGSFVYFALVERHFLNPPLSRRAPEDPSRTVSSFDPPNIRPFSETTT